MGVIFAIVGLLAYILFFSVLFMNERLCDLIMAILTNDKSGIKDNGNLCEPPPPPKAQPYVPWEPQRSYRFWDRLDDRYK